MKTKHTPEPWFPMRGMRVASAYMGPVGLQYVVIEATINSPHITEEEANANMERIVACVNGCAGINPDAVKDLLAAAKHLINHADDSGIYLKNSFPTLRAAIAKAEIKEGT